MVRHIQSSPATTIESVRIGFQESSITKLSDVRVQIGDDYYYYGLDIGFPTSGTDERFDLFALKSIYESSVGIVNADGDSVTPFVQDFFFGTTLEDLEEYGYPNPLKGNGPFSDYHKGQKYLGKTAMEGTVEEDSTTGKITATARFDIKPKRRKPVGSFNHPLTDWYASEYDDDEWEFVFVFDAGTEHEDDFYYENPPLVAFLAKMEDIRTSGDTVTDTAETNPILASTYSARLFTTRFNGQSSDMVFRIITVSRRTYTEGSTTYISHAKVRCRRDSTSSTNIDAIAINAWLQDAENVYGTLNSEDLAVEPTYLGDERTPSLANGLISASGRLRLLEPGIEFDRGGARRFTLGPGHGLVSPHTNLDQDSSNRYLMPINKVGVDVIHCSNTSDITLLIQAPSELILWDLNHYTCELHNVSGNGLVKLQSPNEAEVFALAQGESIKIRLVRQSAGQWEIRFLDVPVRVYEKAMTENSSPFIHLGSTGSGAWGVTWYFNNNNKYFIAPDLDTVSIEKRDAVSFEQNGQHAFPAGAYTALGTDYHANTLKILTTGTLRIEHFIALKSQGSSGSLKAGWGGILQHNDALDNASRVNLYTLAAPDNGSYHIVRELDVEANDLLTFRIIIPSASTIALTSVIMSAKYFKLTLTPNLETITS